MAFCRIGKDSDVYMYETSGNTIVCCGCVMGKVEATEFILYRDAIGHLRKHHSWGHKVPEGVIEGLEDYAKFQGNRVK